jgi:hypothetical protein
MPLRRLALAPAKQSSPVQPSADGAVPSAGYRLPGLAKKGAEGARVDHPRGAEYLLCWEQHEQDSIEAP